MSETTALFGGTFNPIHLGHLAIARAALDELGLEKLVLVPSARPPHKTARPLAPDEDRLEMCRLAVAAAGDPRLEVSDVELRSDGPSYTVR
ncbi:MAG: adenylyltransferase/cytidyltransferase family protein, partial [Anaerolineaceae bacterium]|nr:adenylyltransferase/cytidyltransferase family protein [Anaerolineaceae bacterium]